MAKQPCLIPNKVKNWSSVCCACMSLPLIVSCIVEPIQCTEGNEVEHELTPPTTTQPTKGKLWGRSNTTIIWYQKSWLGSYRHRYRITKLGPVSRKCWKLFGPEKWFVKIRLACSVKLVCSWVVKGIKIKKLQSLVPRHAFVSKI